MVYITHIRTTSGPSAERITMVGWVETASGRSGASTVPQMIDYIAMGNRVRMALNGHQPTTVVTSALLEQQADDLAGRNLLSLPRF